MGGALVHTYFANTSSACHLKENGWTQRRDTFSYSPAALLHTAILCSVLHPAKPPHQKGNNSEAPHQKGNNSERFTHGLWNLHCETRRPRGAYARTAGSRSTSTTRAPHDQDPAELLHAPRACVPRPRLDGFACRHTPRTRAKRHRLERHDQDPAVPTHVPRAPAPRQRLVRHDQDPVPRPARHPPAHVPRRDTRGQPAGESPHL